METYIEITNKIKFKVKKLTIFLSISFIRERRLEAGLAQQQNQQARIVRNRPINDNQQLAGAEGNLQNNPAADNNGMIIRPRHLDQIVRDQQPANPVVNLDNPAVAVDVQIAPPIPLRFEGPKVTLGLGKRLVQKDKNKKMKLIASNTMPLNTELDRANEAPKPKKKKKTVSFEENTKSKDQDTKENK